MFMTASYSALMQSKFFNPAFNSAIFDGPIRIYFAQFHESLALKIYFSLQQRYPEVLALAKEVHKQEGRTALIMLYPSKDSFELSFESKNDYFLVEDNLFEDTVIGINGPFEDENLDAVLAKVVNVLTEWQESKNKVVELSF